MLEIQVFRTRSQKQRHRPGTLALGGGLEIDKTFPLRESFAFFLAFPVLREERERERERTRGAVFIVLSF